MERPAENHEPGHIARLVASQRRRRGLSQCDLGMAIGWSERSIRRLERGELEWVHGVENGAAPGMEELKVLRALAAQLHIALDTLLRPPDVVAPSALTRPAVIPEVVDSPEPAAGPSPATLPSASWSTAPAVRAHSLAPWAGRLRLLAITAGGGALVSGGGLACAMTGGIHLPYGAPPHATARLTAQQGPALLPHPVRRLPAQVIVPAQPLAVAPAAPAVAPPPAAPRVTTAAIDVRRVVSAAHPVTGPIATLSTTSIDFGWIAVGSSVSRTVTLTNTGNGPLHVQYVWLVWADGVSVGENRCESRTLAPGQSCGWTLTYHPTKDGMLAPFPEARVLDDGADGYQAVKLQGATT